MENKYHFKLIDGKFMPEEAGSLLLDLIESKLKFHSLEKFSIQVRYDGDTVQSERRMAELREMSQSISSIAKAAGAAGKQIRIAGNIELIIE